VSQRAEGPDRVDHFRDHLDVLLALAGRHKIEPASLLLDAKLLQRPQQQAVALDGAIVPLLVVAIAGMTRQNQHAIGAQAEGLQNELRIDAAAAHDPDDSHVVRAGDLGGAGFVGAGVGAPVAQKADDLRFEHAGARGRWRRLGH